jgi:hypothetical protein
LWLKGKGESMKDPSEGHDDDDDGDEGNDDEEKY